MRYRKTRRKKHNKQIKVIIGCSFCFLFLMVVGYAAFNTNLNITAKGNIMEKPYTEIGGIKVNIVTDGNGLYEDECEDGRYVYRGKEPNNYIRFNDELWRIIAKESDDTYKIITNNSIGSMQWDTIDNRNNDNNSYCNIDNTYIEITKYWGCNAWAAVAGDFVNGQYHGTVTTDATLNTYLNTEYYTSLSNDKSYIINHLFNVGEVDRNSLEGLCESEANITWNGKVGLMNLSDYLKASTNEECISYADSRLGNACSYENGNYLDELKTESWTINHYDYTLNKIYSSGVHTVSYTDEGMCSGYYSTSYYQVRPVVFLSSMITLEGEGTINNPFVITN